MDGAIPGPSARSSSAEGACHERGGIFGTAQQTAACLTNRKIATWVTPAGNPGRPQFVPETFVKESTGTLYSLSNEGKGTAGPLVTALTVAVAEAAGELQPARPADGF